MVDFKSLKKSSEDITRLTKEIEKINAPQADREEDARFWQPQVDKSKNGSAVIRFLPAPAVDGDDALPWVRTFRHAFEGLGGKWYFENSLTTLNQKDPVSEYNSTLWALSNDDDSPSRKQVRNQKRKLEYISNIRVISDPKAPENEGKEFLYKYGKKIFDKIEAAMSPEFEGDVPVNVFDFWKGANFRMKIKDVGGYRNYDDSSFAAPSALPLSDEELEAIWKREYSLKEFIAPDKFKTYDELKARLNEVLGIGTGNPSAGRAQQAAKVEEETLHESVADNSGPADEDEELKMFRELV